MKKNNLFGLVLLMFSTYYGTAQTKSWTLEECVKYALENNISIKNTDLDTKTADINIRGAKGSFLPSVNANASHTWNIGLNQDITTGLLRNQTTQFSSLNATVGVDIYRGLQNQNNLRRAKMALVASQYQLLKMKEDVALNIANAFLQVLFNKENLKVQNEQLAIVEKQQKQSEELVKAGSIPRGDLLDVKANVATNKQNVVTAENALLISKLSLAQLLQLKEFYDFDVIDNTSLKDENNILAQPVDAIYDKAKETRTELKIAQTNLEIAEKDVRIAKGAYQPTVQGFYNLNTRAAYSQRIVGFGIDPLNPTSQIGFVEGTNQKVLAPNTAPILGDPNGIFEQFRDNKGQVFGLQLSVPIFNGWSVRNNVDRNKVNFEKSKIALEQQQLDLQRNVYTAFTDAKGALKTHESAIVALESRQEAFNYAKERYAVGMMNAFDFNQAQTLLTNAQSEVIRTKYDYIFKIKILEFYFGIPIIKS